jgi:hypothetical protein
MPGRIELSLCKGINVFGRRRFSYDYHYKSKVGQLKRSIYGHFGQTIAIKHLGDRR